MMLENLLEEEGLAGLSGSGDQNSGPVTESDHDREWIVILIGDLMKFLSEEDAESLYSSDYMRVIDTSQSYGERSRYRLVES